MLLHVVARDSAQMQWAINNILLIKQSQSKMVMSN